MADLVILGATPAGAHLKATRSSSDRVIAFADFAAPNTGGSFEGLPVIHPAALLALPFDRVVIAGHDGAGALTFLLKLGIPLEKIGAEAAVSSQSDRRPTAIIYGARIEGQRTLQHIERHYRVLCFCDEDGSLHGKQVAGRFVVAPADLAALSFDRIFIGAADTYKTVHDLLWYRNVPIDKMDVAPEDVLFPATAAREDGRPRRVIFGAGSSGELMFHRFSATSDIIAFVDNNTAKHGKEFCGRPIHPPLALTSLDYDQVVVGSMFAGEIVGQLTQLGVDPARIVLPNQAAA